ncbi:GcrA family cell cycle regulator [Methyloligella sp. 2.7D]|uniref:GcrA family cell cycle regulator n=1 Tax=unclassified Methyloligella TaxID=2625955 RepID=UPI00157C4C75|nr:GcrA family cell cycle regulator [Methyloligella sp. GL2]QKP78506.1 GcrA cell cycle regulator [Methyloligella sp. GL2]
MAWNEERVELLKKLWADGLSASQIAGRLGGVTRNAVIGKVHRLGLSGRATTSRSSAPRVRRTHTPRPQRQPQVVYATRGATALKPSFEEEEEVQVAPAPAVEELVIPLHERATILDLKENMCRWPIGDPGEEGFHFCGRKSPVGVPYCEHHARMAYQPVQRRRDKRSATG